MNKNRKTAVTQIRRTHLGRYLFELNKAYQRISLGYLQAKGFPEMTIGYLHVLSQIDLLHGTSMQTIIERVGTSKQAVSRTLLACEKLGYIERVPSAADARALSVCFKHRGEQLMSAAAEAAIATEKVFAEKLGKARFAALKTTLAEVAEILQVVKVDPP